jgi:hypothetical protein
MRSGALRAALSLVWSSCVLVSACGGGPSSGFHGSGNGARPDGGGQGSGDDAGAFGDDAAGDDGGTFVGDPTTCDQAATSRSYVGCDYWPTTITNSIWSIFDFAVVVANPQSSPVTVTVTGAGGVNVQSSVAPGALAKIYLPWNLALKGPDWDTCTNILDFTSSVTAPKGAYHLVSSAPVTVYEFSALEYDPKGGPSGKDWSTCPGDQNCADYQNTPIGCHSFSNDASLLLPSTAMTGHYRLTGIASVSKQGSYFAVTGTRDGTHVSVTLSKTASVAAGGSIAAAGPGATVAFALDAGDVVELVGPGGSEDISGSLLVADQPVQVLGGHPCMAIPSADPNATCDHLEASVFPAETLGKHYVVTVPTGPNAVPVSHLVRIYGNVDGTKLTYTPARPPGCPTTIDAGVVGDCGYVTSDFEIQGDHEFTVGTFQESADVVDPQAMTDSRGDPSMSFATAVEQYRSRYIFLAPSDYDVNFADVVVAPGTTLTLDGAPVSVTPVPVGPSFSVLRIPLQTGANDGAHVISGSQAFGIQVMGYGAYTSYQYPGGLDLRAIAPVPPR